MSKQLEHGMKNVENCLKSQKNVGKVRKSLIVKNVGTLSDWIPILCANEVDQINFISEIGNLTVSRFALLTAFEGGCFRKV